MMSFNAFEAEEELREEFTAGQARLLAKLTQMRYEHDMNELATKAYVADEIEKLGLKLGKDIAEAKTAVQGSLWKVAGGLAILGTVYKFFG